MFSTSYKFPNLPDWAIELTFWGGVFGLIVWFAMWLYSKKDNDGAVSAGSLEIHNVTSHDQSGGITAHTVNIDTDTQRTFTPELKSSLLQDLPNDRPVQVMGMNGDSESMNFATEIYDGLKAGGYTMLGDSAISHMFFNPPVFNIKINEGNGGAEWWIVVGPAN